MGGASAPTNIMFRGNPYVLSTLTEHLNNDGGKQMLVWLCLLVVSSISSYYQEDECWL